MSANVLWEPVLCGGALSDKMQSRDGLLTFSVVWHSIAMIAHSLQSAGHHQASQIGPLGCTADKEQARQRFDGWKTVDRRCSLWSTS